MAAVLAVMILLMICGCLYIRDFFRRNENESSTQKADVVRETISGVEEDELDADLSGEENHMVGKCFPLGSWTRTAWKRIF